MVVLADHEHSCAQRSLERTPPLTAENSPAAAQVCGEGLQKRPGKRDPVIRTFPQHFRTTKNFPDEGINASTTHESETRGSAKQGPAARATNGHAPEGWARRRRFSMRRCRSTTQQKTAGWRSMARCVRAVRRAPPWFEKARAARLRRQLCCVQVYDVTNFLDQHPGGAEVMMEVAGEAPSLRVALPARTPGRNPGRSPTGSAAPPAAGGSISRLPRSGRRPTSSRPFGGTLGRFFRSTLPQIR